jgi:osmotically inducible protein OsmC
MKRHATAVWTGTGKEGKGHLSTKSKALDHTPYNYRMRFEDEHGTNPEELLAAAHAGCFTMKVSFLIVAAGFVAEKLETECSVELVSGSITSSHLTLKAKVPGLSDEKFQELVEDARQNCPVSKVLNATITAEAKLHA